MTYIYIFNSVFWAWELLTTQGVGWSTVWTCTSSQPSDVWLSSYPKGNTCTYFSKFHKFFYFKKILGLLTKAYTCMHITEGNRGGWPGPEDKNGYWAWWSYHEMRAWSKWKPCYPEMYWMYTRRFGSVHYLDILRSSCSTVHSPLWLQSHTGWSFNSELSNSST
jgi:hypothetical protein